MPLTYRGMPSSAEEESWCRRPSDRWGCRTHEALSSQLSEDKEESSCARAIGRKAAYLLADEPPGISPANGEAVMELLRDLTERAGCWPIVHRDACERMRGTPTDRSTVSTGVWARRRRLPARPSHRECIFLAGRTIRAGMMRAIRRSRQSWWRRLGSGSERPQHSSACECAATAQAGMTARWGRGRYLGLAIGGGESRC